MTILSPESIILFHNLLPQLPRVKALESGDFLGSLLRILQRKRKFKAIFHEHAANQPLKQSTWHGRWTFGPEWRAMSLQFTALRPRNAGTIFYRQSSWCFQMRWTKIVQVTGFSFQPQLANAYSHQSNLSLSLSPLRFQDDCSTLPVVKQGAEDRWIIRSAGHVAHGNHS